MRDQGSAAKGGERRELVSPETAAATVSPTTLGSGSVSLGRQFPSPVCRERVVSSATDSDECCKNLLILKTPEYGMPYFRSSIIIVSDILG